MKIHLRQRKQTKKGKISLYLELYKGTVNLDGKVKPIREYEYLNLYLIDKPKTQADKQHNKEVLELANNIKDKRLIEVKNNEHGFKNSFKEKVNFIAYFKEMADEKNDKAGNHGNWLSTYKHLTGFAGSNVQIKNIDEDFCNGFKDYLKNKAKKSSGLPLASSSISSYFTKFRACLNMAVKEKIILSNPALNVSTPKSKNTKREYLTLDELKAIVKVECRYEVLKRAFIFSCLTGLRWSDINNLKWSDYQKTDTGHRITFNQQKTGGLQYLDISEQARQYLGQIGSPLEKVFIGLKYSSYMNVELSKWMLRAGITKDITFHSGRHTFAVLQLSLGTEIYTLSKLLGHSEIRTTQIYAEIIDKKKLEAVNKIPDINI